MTFKYYRTEIKIFQDCISCHVDGAPGDVNRTAFSLGEHLNINTTGGIDSVNNTDCWTCHFNRDMNRSNILQCNYCHTGSAKLVAPTAPRIKTHISGVAITNYSCVDCHSKVIIEPGAGIPNVTSHYLKRPTISGENYCDYCHGPDASSPFNATNKTIPAFSHDNTSWNGNATCRECHTNTTATADPLANDATSFHDLTNELGDAYNGTTKADCFVCHVEKSPQFVAAPNPTHDVTGYDAADCRGCHTSGSGTNAQKLHSVSASATGGCIACHTGIAPENPGHINISLYGRHANVNISDGIGNLTDIDCKTCHFGSANGSMKMKSGAANSSNTYFCEACHTSAGTGPIHPTDLIKDGLQHGSTNCQWCHIAGALLPRPLDITLRYHSKGPLGTAAEKNCLTCHYDKNLPDLPFHAPGIVHSTDLNECSYCHDDAINHKVTYLKNTIRTPPIISQYTINGSSGTISITSGNPAYIRAKVSSGMFQIAAAQFAVTNGSGTVINWTNMTGAFNSQDVVVNATLDTTSLNGSYNLVVRGMASAPKKTSGPYYPFNGEWSTNSYRTFNVIQPTGYNNGTVSGRLGNGLAGAIVSANNTVWTTTNETGFYSLSLTNGTYRLIASKEPEYYSNSSVVVTVTAYTTVNRDIVLTPRPTGNISGTVRNK
jgi:nitrate/TMAO reductase-like tetraheme cytochrome c subunit